MTVLHAFIPLFANPGTRRAPSGDVGGGDLPRADRGLLHRGAGKKRIAAIASLVIGYAASGWPFLIGERGRPESSYRLNADFEVHTEHEYMAYVAGHPEPAPGAYAAEYGRYGSLADLLRQIGHDERIHKLASVASMAAPRFGHPAPAGTG